MQIADNQIVEIYIVTPGNENLYEFKRKEDFLDGSLYMDLYFTKTVMVPSSRLREMWKNTKILVLRPRESWRKSIEMWLNDQDKA